MEEKDKPEPFYPELEGMEGPEQNDDGVNDGKDETEGGTKTSTEGSVA